jgi:hypothetical protein
MALQAGPELIELEWGCCREMAQHPAGARLHGQAGATNQAHRAASPSAGPGCQAAGTLTHSAVLAWR